jgi:tetratricopeptide (TPR) repeat protein
MRLSLARVPYVMPVLGLYKFEGRPYLGMPEAVPGPDGATTLRDRLRSGDPLIDEVLKIAWCIAYGMVRGAAVVPGLVHGDLKPENVLMPLGLPHIADFGLARFHHDVKPAAVAIGTPPYSAPELEREGAEPSQRSDIFSFGVILIDLLAGYLALLEQEPQWLTESPLGRYVAYLVQLAVWCGEGDPEDRPHDFAEVVAALESVSDALGLELPARDYFKESEAQFSEDQMSDYLGSVLESFLGLNEYDLVVEQVETVPAAARTHGLWMVYGDALTAQDRLREAMDAFLAAGEGVTEPREITAVVTRVALTLKRLEDYAAAAKMLEEHLPLVQGAQEKTAVYVNLASVRFAAEQYPLAYQAALRALSMDPGQVVAWRLAAQALRHTHNHREAVQAASNVIAREPHDPHNYEDLADILLDIGMLEPARHSIGRSIATGGQPLDVLARALLIATTRDQAREVEELDRLLRTNFTEEQAALVRAHAAQQIAGGWSPQPYEPQNIDLSRLSSVGQMLERGDPTELYSNAVRMDGNVITTSVIPESSKDDSIPFANRIETARGEAYDMYATRDATDLLGLYLKVFRHLLDAPESGGLGTLSPQPFIGIVCECSARIVTNRVTGRRFVCRRCDRALVAGDCDPAMAQTVADLNERIGLVRRSADCLLLFVVALESDESAPPVVSAVASLGWYELDPGRYAAMLVRGFAARAGVIKPDLVYRFLARRVDWMWINDTIAHDDVLDLHDLLSEIPEALVVTPLEAGSTGEQGSRQERHIKTMSVNADLDVDPFVSKLLLGDIDAAEQVLDADDPDPEHASRWSLLAQEAQRAGRPGLALRSARRGVQLGPDTATPWAVLGQVLEAQEQHDEARECVQTALRIDPTHPLSPEMTLMPSSPHSASGHQGDADSGAS